MLEPGLMLRRRDLRDAGLDPAGISRLLRSGRLVRVGFDRFTTPGVPVTAAAVMASAGQGFALSHASAARAWGLPTADEATHVVVPNGGNRRWRAPGVVLHQTRGWEADVVDRHAVTPLARTLLDIAQTSPLSEALPTLDAGLRLGVCRDELIRRASTHRQARALALADGRAESPLESRLRLVLTLAQLPPTDLQHEVRENGRLVGRVDLWYPGVVVEADGFAFHSGRDDYRRDRRKGQAFGRLGLLVLRFSWEDVTFAPDVVVQTVRATVVHAA